MNTIRSHQENNVIPTRIRCSRATLGIAALGLLALIPTQMPAQHTFPIESIFASEDFESYAPGSTLADNGWTGGGASDTVIQAPSNPAVNLSDQVAVVQSGTTRVVAQGPNFADPVPFALGDTLFLSAWVRKSSGAASGAAVTLRHDTSNVIAGFRLFDTSDDAFALRGAGGNSTNYTTSETTFSRNVWYELILTIDLHATDVSLSTGSLFYRNVNAGHTTFTAVADLQNILLDFDETVNPLTATGFRFEFARGDVEIDNLQFGKIIPEPQLGLLSLGLLTAWMLRRKTCR